MNAQEALAALRLQGISDMREVKVARMEVDGQVSVIREEWAEPLEKGDVLRNAPPLGGEPPEEERTDTPRAMGMR